MAFLQTMRHSRFRLTDRLGAVGRRPEDSETRPVLARVIAAPMIAVAIMSLVCLGLLSDLTSQSAAMRRLVDLDLDNAVVLSRLDRELSQLELASATDRLTPETAGPQLVAIRQAINGDSLRDDPALTRLRHEMAELSSHPDGKAQMRSLRSTILRRQLDAQSDAQARADAMQAEVQRSTLVAVAGALLAVLMGAVAASVSLRSLQMEFVAVARIARRLAEVTRAQGPRKS